MWLDQILNEGQHADRLRSDLEYFAANALKLRPKVGALEPFILNPAQRKLHELLEQQRRETGRVRAIILKARQLGVSTYVAARFFHRTINSPGVRTLIVGHERAASRNLYGIVRRFYDNLPDSNKPSVGTSNQEELIFDKMDAGYLVSVATTEGAGRSATAQCLHASEVAYWPSLETQVAALLQTIPDADGTEIILESTADGFNEFYQLWRRAEAGESEFMPIFLPWFGDKAYRRDTGPNFQMDEAEKETARLHGLVPEQVAWRRAKMVELRERFQQEYPEIASDAFLTPNSDNFIPAELVVIARREEVEPFGPLLIGVDPAGMGPDRTSIAWRRGHRILKVESRRGLNTMQVCGWVSKIIADEKPAAVFIDVGGLGVGVYDRLVELGHQRTAVAVNFGGHPIEPQPLDEAGRPAGGAANRRSEMWAALKKALEEGRTQLPDSDSLQADLTSVGYRYTSAGQLLLESKQDLRKRGVPSPDEADAVALTFAEPSGFRVNKNFNRDLREAYAKQNLYV